MSLDLDADTFAIELANEIERTAAYLNDLRRLQAGQYPSDADLSAATVIREARKGQRPTGCITGLWPGSDQPAMSSRLLILAASAGWARTASGLYRLEGWQS